MKEEQLCVLNQHGMIPCMGDGVRLSRMRQDLFLLQNITGTLKLQFFSKLCRAVLGSALYPTEFKNTDSHKNIRDPLLRWIASFCRGLPIMSTTAMYCSVAHPDRSLFLQVLASKSLYSGTLLIYLFYKNRFHSKKWLMFKGTVSREKCSN